MAVYRIKLVVKGLAKVYYTKLPDLVEAQTLALHTAAQLEGGVQGVEEVPETEFLTEVQQARFIYLE